MLRGDVVAVRREAAEVGRAGGDELAPPVGEVRRDLDADVGHQPPRLGDQALHVLDPDRTSPVRQRQLRPSVGDAGAPVVAGGGVGDLGGLLPVVALVGNEVLEDHLLDVPVAGVQLGDRGERVHPLLLGLADADEDAARERDLQLAGGGDRLQAPRRVLGRRAGVDGLHQPLGDRLEHQPLRGGHLAQPGEVLARQHAEVGVRQDAALERPFARPDDVGGEVLVPVRGEPLANRRIDLRALAGQHQQLLDAPPRRAVEQPDHLLGRVQVRLVGRERAVLAVAAAGPRQRQRQVAREGDPAAHARIL